MLIDCHSPQPKCISIPICHPVICCNCPSKCVCLTNCCSKTPSSLNFKTDICEDLLESKCTYELSSGHPLTPYTSMPATRLISNQLRYSTPDIRKINSKTNSYFNIDRNNSNDNFIHNIQTPLNFNDKYNENYDDNDNENDNNYDINNHIENNKKSISFKPNLSITRNNSINYTYRKKLNNRELIKNKSSLNKRHELLDKIKCISHRLDKTIRIFNAKNNGIYNKNRIGKNRNIHEYNKRFNSNENIHDFNKNRKNKKNISRYLNEMNQIRLDYDKNYILEKIKKNNEREKQMIAMKLKNLSDVINNGNNVKKNINNNLLEMKKNNPNNNKSNQNEYFIDNRLNINDINQKTFNDDDNQNYDYYEENEDNNEELDNRYKNNYEEENISKNLDENKNKKINNRKERNIRISYKRQNDNGRDNDNDNRENYKEYDPNDKYMNNNIYNDKNNNFSYRENNNINNKKNPNLNYIQNQSNIYYNNKKRNINDKDDNNEESIIINEKKTNINNQDNNN